MTGIKLTIPAACIALNAIVILRHSLHDAIPKSPNVHDGLAQITPQRAPMKQPLATLCMAPSTPFGPHAEPTEILVYANTIALDYRRQHPREYDYPIGSKFVKEKYAHKADQQPDLATIMERISKVGDDSDWRFSIVSLPDKIELHPTGGVACASCHVQFEDRGSVSDESESALRWYLKIEQ